jgi:hypothetical protein
MWQMSAPAASVADPVPAATAADDTSVSVKPSRTSGGVFDGLSDTLGKVGAALNPVNWFAAGGKAKEIGFGCMGMSAFYGSAATTSEADAIAVFKHAVANGVKLFNTATFYGPLNEKGFGANLRLLKKCIQEVDRSKIQIMCKIGMDTRAPVEKTGTQWIMRGDAASIRADVEYAYVSPIGGGLFVRLADA